MPTKKVTFSTLPPLPPEVKAAVVSGSVILASRMLTDSDYRDLRIEVFKQVKSDPDALYGEFLTRAKDIIMEALV